MDDSSRPPRLIQLVRTISRGSTEMPPIIGEVLNSTTDYFLELIIKGNVTQSNGDLRPVLNILHWRYTSGVGTLNAGAFMGSFQTAFETNFLAAMPSTYNFLGYSVRSLNNYYNPVLDLPVSANGGVATDRTTLFNAVFMIGDTTSRGRNFSPKKHFGPIPESFTDADELNTTGKAAWDLVLGDLNSVINMSDGVGTTWSQICLSQQLSVLGNEPSRTASYALIVAWSRSDIVGTMRHRKERRIVT